MKIEYRRLTEKELNTFIDMRIKQLREEGDGIYYNICEGGIVYGCFKGDLVLLFGRSYSAFCSAFAVIVPGYAVCAKN